MTDRTVLLVRAPAGVSGYGIAKWSEKENSFTTSFYCNDFYDGGDRSPFSKLEEGGFLLDKTVAPYDNIIDGVISGPLLDILLPAGTHERFGERGKRAAAAMLGPGGLQGAFATIAVQAIVEKPNKFGSLDKISLDLYLDFWRNLGARVGRKVKGVAIWEGQLDLL